MPHRSWLIGLFVLTSHAFPQNSFHRGTSIAIVRTEKEIVIASDSRAVDGNGKLLPDTCKIRSAGKWQLSLNGMASNRAADVFSIVGRILRRPGDIADRSTAIVNSLTPLLSSAVKSDPALREYALAQGSLLGITVFGSESKVLKLTSIKFVVSEGESFPTNVIIVRAIVPKMAALECSYPLLMRSNSTGIRNRSLQCVTLC